MNWAPYWDLSNIRVYSTGEVSKANQWPTCAHLIISSCTVYSYNISPIDIHQQDATIRDCMTNISKSSLAKDDSQGSPRKNSGTLQPHQESSGCKPLCSRKKPLWIRNRNEWNLVRERLAFPFVFFEPCLWYNPCAGNVSIMRFDEFGQMTNAQTMWNHVKPPLWLIKSMFQDVFTHVKPPLFMVKSPVSVTWKASPFSSIGFRGQVTWRPMVHVPTTSVSTLPWRCLAEIRGKSSSEIPGDLLLVEFVEWMILISHIYIHIYIYAHIYIHILYI